VIPVGPAEVLNSSDTMKRFPKTRMGTSVPIPLRPLTPVHFESAERNGLQEREEEWRNQAAIRIARSLNLPLLATNGVWYATTYEREILDLFTAVRNYTQLDRAGRLLSLNSQRHLRPAKEMA